MASRKRTPQPRSCAVCGATFSTARQGHVHCSGTCNTRAWRARKAQQQPAKPGQQQDASPVTLSAPTQSPLEPAPATPPAPVALAFTAVNLSTMAVGTAAGNLLSEGLKALFAPTSRAASAPAAAFPTWPPAELLAAVQPARWVSSPAWLGQLWLTPTTYHGHTLHLYAQAGLPYVLWQAPHGEWRLLTTPTELAQLAALRPLPPLLRAKHAEYGLVQPGSLIGLPLPPADEASLQLAG